MHVNKSISWGNKATTTYDRAMSLATSEEHTMQGEVVSDALQRAQQMARNIGNVTFLACVIEKEIKVGDKIGLGIYGIVYKVHLVAYSQQFRY